MPRQRTGGPSRSLTRLSVADLNREIRHRQRGLKSLHRRRQQVLAKIAAIDSEILAHSGKALPATEGGRVRPRNDANLIDSLRAVLKDKTMGVTEAAQAVQKAGYRSSSANFRVMVNIALAKKQFFKRNAAATPPSNRRFTRRTMPPAPRE